ncbi:hypothetical protein BEN47_06345 [Hymenobacter lapidarius]|uniref:Lipocalin-like domain-containing protein n=1 Tax=Hymenobacter lapidarius TaxID=1908237 RepID=A0A1G1SQF9_9BACT|nr:hypothetical protein [Hymenobacter lapidarius]OGX80870.1 hypothetical protein BEN47_06345 [Hymenobacter lapidarius]
MSNLLSSVFLFLAFTCVFTSCKKDTGAVLDENGDTAGLVGTWQLTQRECLCPRTVPNELVKFTDTGFIFLTDGQPSAYGTYSVAPAGVGAGGQDTPPVLQLTYANIPSTIRKAAIITLTSNSLVLDFGIAFDAPRDTYKRLQ